MANVLNIPNLLVPEVVPGGQFQTPIEEDRWRATQDTINNIINELNELIIDNTSTTINVGSGGLSPFDIIAHTTQNKSAVAPLYSNRQIQEAFDGQLVVCWYEWTGSGNDYLYRFLKAESPFKQWTNLAGDSASPTEIAITTPAGGGCAPCFACDPDTGNIYAFTFNSSLEWQCHCFPYAGDGAWDTTYNSVVVATFADTKFSSLPSCLIVGGRILFATRKAGTGALSDTCLYTGTPSTTTSAGWGLVINFRGIYDGTTYYDFPNTYSQVRLTYLGNGSVMLLWDWADSSTRGNIAYSLSADYGATWGYRALNGGGYYIYFNDLASGNVITVDATGDNVGSDFNFSGSGTPVAARWEASAYRGDKVGVLYAEGRTSTSDAGVRYAEWTLGDGFRTTANHVTLTGNRQVRATGMVTDGDIVRALWLDYHSFTSTVRLYGINYRRVVASGNSGDLLDWQMERQLLQHAADNTTDAVAGFDVLPDGFVTISNQSFLPVLLARANNDVSANCAILFRLIPLTVMDGN